MHVVDGEEDLCCVELGSFFWEAFAFPEVGKHFSSPDEVHDEEYFFFGLEGVL